jgi:hypothetical protein
MIGLFVKRYRGWIALLLAAAVLGPAAIFVTAAQAKTMPPPIAICSEIALGPGQNAPGGSAGNSAAKVRFCYMPDGAHCVFTASQADVSCYWPK